MKSKTSPSLKKHVIVATLIPVLLLSITLSALYLVHRLNASANLALLHTQASLQTTAAVIQQHIQSARTSAMTAEPKDNNSANSLSQRQKSFFETNLQQTLNQAMSNPLIRSTALIYHPKGKSVEGKTVIHTGPQMLDLSNDISPAVAKTKKLFNQNAAIYPQQILLLSSSTFRLSTPVFPRPGQHPDLSLTFEIDPTQLTAERYEIIAVALLTVLVSVILSALSAALLYRKIKRPLKSLRARVSRLAQGQLNFQANPSTFAELAYIEKSLEETVNTITQAREELELSASQATEDLRQTLDTIEIQNIELDLARKEALEASRIKSEFLANMSHEIRTPLNGIMGFTKLLLKSPLAYKHREYLDTIHKSADGLLTIINDILDFSKIEAGKLALEHISFNLSAIIEEALTMVSPLAHEKQLELINLFFAESKIEVLGDPLRIKQVITNLVNNAIKFTDHGCITVRTTTESTSENFTVFKVSVTDTGIGLTDAEQNNLFKAFSQGDASSARKYGGTGLGLVICKHLVRQMGGEIGFHSEHQTGSTFWFTLKLSINRNVRVIDDAPPELREKHILVFDANPLVRLSLRHILEQAHVSVSEVETLDEIFPKLAPSAQPFVDAILLGTPQHHLSASELSDLVSLLEEQYNRKCLILCDTHQLYQLQNRLPLAPGHILSKPVARPKLQNSLASLLQAPNEYTEEVHAKPAENGSLQSYSAHKRISVLCVDDNHPNLTLIRALLEELHVDVTTCDNGFKALEVVGQTDFDIIFMDIQMPRMDGVVTTRKIRALERGGRTPVVALTAHALPSEKQSLIQAGMDEYITKPVNEPQLISILEKHTEYRHKRAVQTSGAGAPSTPPVKSPQLEKLDRARHRVKPQSQLNSKAPFHSTAQAKPKPVKPTVAPSDTKKATMLRVHKVFDEQEHLALSNHKADLAEELLDMLIDSLPEARFQILKAWDQENYDALLEHTHKLHGATRYCGVPALRHSLNILETHLKKSNVAALPESVKAALEAISQLQNLQPQNSRLKNSKAQSSQIQKKKSDQPEPTPT